MFGLLLAAYLTQAAANNPERPPRPSEDQLLAAVLEDARNARIVSSSFNHGAGGRGCGLIEIDGTTEPFSVHSAWKENGPGAAVVSSVSVRDQNGQMQEHRIEPKPPQWEIMAVTPSHVDAEGDGLDWRERNLDVAMRRLALTMCPTLTAPQGTVWALEFEPDPDPARAARNERRAAALTDMLFGGASPAPPPPPATRP